jgi:hypothetical protein
LEVNFTVLKTHYNSVCPLILKNIYHNFPIDGKKHEVKDHKIPLLLELTEISSVLNDLEKGKKGGV